MQDDLGLELVELAEEVAVTERMPKGVQNEYYKMIKQHLFKIFHTSFQRYKDYRPDLGALKCVAASGTVIQDLKELLKKISDAAEAAGEVQLARNITTAEDSWYMRHRTSKKRLEAAAKAKEEAQVAAASAEVGDKEGAGVPGVDGVTCEDGVPS